MCASARQQAATEGSAKEAGKPHTSPRRCLSMDDAHWFLITMDGG